MANLNQEKHFKIIKNHEKMEVKFLRTTTVDTKIDLIKNRNISWSDFMQDDIGNCGLIDSMIVGWLAAVS